MNNLTIRELTIHDNEALQNMNTGIEQDYVKRIFTRVIENEGLYGAFVGDEMVAIGGYTIYANHYAVLGRLRTHVNYRGKGIATRLLRHVLQTASDHPQFKWIGLATQVHNDPAQNVVKHLPVEPMTTIHSLKLNKKGIQQWQHDGEQYKNEWIEVKDSNTKRRLLNSLPIEENALKAFPYACYYPLPFENSLWDDDYLAKNKMWQRGDRFFLLAPDEKGQSYYHFKYFWNDSFDQKGLWSLVIQEAIKEDRVVWYDASPQGFKNIPNMDCFDTDDPWMLFGRYIKQKASVR